MILSLSLGRDVSGSAELVLYARWARRIFPGVHTWTRLDGLSAWFVRLSSSSVLSWLFRWLRQSRGAVFLHWALDFL
jgi:hypothetical protein